MKITSKHNRSSRNITFQTILLFLQRKTHQLQIVVLGKVGKDYRQDKTCTRLLLREMREISHLLMISIQQQPTIHLVLRSLQ